MRLFVSIEPPADLKKRLDAILSSGPAIRKVPGEQLHLTLLFIGEAAAYRADQMAQALSEIRFEPFELTISTTGAFPGLNNPKVLWAGIRDSDQLWDLQSRIAGRVCPLMKSPEPDHAFHPHITLGRVKAGRSVTFIKRDLLLPPFTVNEFLLKESRQQKGRRIHETHMTRRAEQNSTKP